MERTGLRAGDVHLLCMGYLRKLAMVTLAVCVASCTIAGSPDRSELPKVLRPGDTSTVAAYYDMVQTIDDALAGEALPFAYVRDLVQVLARFRPSSEKPLMALGSVLTLRDPSYQEPGPYQSFGGIGLPLEDTTPGPWALARVGAPAIPILSRAAREGSPEEREKAQQAVALMLRSAAVYWYTHWAEENAVVDNAEWGAAMDSARSRGPLPCPESNGLLNLFLVTPREVPPRLQCPPIAALLSDDPGTRYLAKRGLHSQRERVVHDLAVRIGDAERRPDDRASAATTLGLIRGVSQGSAERLIAMMGKEVVRPGVRLTEEDTPAALALVRIGIPIVPVLTDTIRLSGDERLRSNCAGVMAVMLGRYAKPWLADVQQAATGQTQQHRVAQVLEAWGPHCTGEGYYAEGGT